VKEFRIKHHFNIVLKIYVMLLKLRLFNDYAYKSISNVASIKIINSS
jgi:hypothetical protein